MTTRVDLVPPEIDGTFRHEALLYAGEDGFVERVSGFVNEGVAAGEPVFVVVAAPKIDLLRGALEGDTREVFFADMNEVGRNPARIIPAWHDFVGAQPAGRRFRGVGEPIWAERGADELVECQRHEALLNRAFEDGPGWWLVCPYDVGTLDDSVIGEMWRTHPYVHDGSHVVSTDYVDPPDAFDAPLPDPPRVAVPIDFDPERVDLLRRRVGEEASRNGLSRAEVDEFVLAVHELATNSIKHGGGGGLLRVWHDDGRMVAEVRDHGYLDQPLVGRQRPATHRTNGRGLWLVNHLCDLVQIRTSDTGTVVRVHKAPNLAS
jgi:anti-sigma regulatory factor (Ser/Thr protein kinase)